MKDFKYCIGLMTGTSLDGIDVALCKIVGFGLNTKLELVEFETYKYTDNVLSDIKDTLSIEKSNSQLICSLNFKLGYEYSDAIKRLVTKANLELSDISFIASHGQTIYHQAHDNGNIVRSSLQIGDAATIAYQCQSTVVSNFRCGDIAAGGQGAPLVPYVDYVLYRDIDKIRALHNIGGISNTTILPYSCSIDDVVAFDTGPGNMMIDRAMNSLYHKGYDDNGDIASSGKLIKDLYDDVISHEYFNIAPPKSTGREMFGFEYVDNLLSKYKDSRPEEIIHTLTIITANSIAMAYQQFVIDKYSLDEIIFTGGGAYNGFLIATIAKKLPKVKVLTMEDIGHSSDAKEAIAFAVLGNETLYKNYNNVPSATGSNDRVILGQVNYF